MILLGQPPKGIGPRWSASGPNAATGRKRRAPIITIVPNKRNAKVGVSSLMVPELNGVGFFAPRKAASAIGATIGRYRLNRITNPVPMSQGTASGAGLGLLFSP